jgi:hypothetical protein
MQPKRDEEILGQLVSWTIEHCEVDANFEGVSILLIGDPVVLAGSELPEKLVPPWSWLPGERTGVAVRGPLVDGDGPFVWVMTTDDGPIESIQISPELRLAPRHATPRPVGWIDVPSGRLVVGNTASVRFWGPTVDLDERPVAEFRVGEKHEGLIRDGYLVVVRLAVPGPCEVLVQDAREEGEIAGITIRPKRANWLPAQKPILRPSP